MISPLVIGIVYLLFFLSGSAALVYQIAWVRSLTLVFGGSHLAVTAVLSIFMGGLALGSYTAGRRIDRVARPLRVYGLIELGIAAAAILFAALTAVYPAIYAVLARGRDDALVYLTLVRLTFSVVALLLPTALMGATLPVITRFVAGQPEAARRHLSFLYGVNTLGSVAGALIAGFVLLRFFAVSTALTVAICTNAAIGLASLWLSRVIDAAPAPAPAEAPDVEPVHERDAMVTLVLWAIGISGFCALGYEVLWTRVLTLAVGASVYGFTLMLVAFLSGIALGSKAYGVAIRFVRTDARRPGALVTVFGFTQIAIGISALLVTIFLRDVPATAVRLENYFSGAADASFGARAWAGFGLAVLYMIVPALFMGAAVPMAAEVVVRQRQRVGLGVGEVIGANTLGAIFGAAVSGLVLVRLFGIERSLQILTLTNIGVGAVVVAARSGRRAVMLSPAMVALAAIGAVALYPDATRIWDRKYFAIFRSNQPEAFRTPDMIREAVENTDVLYYHEGLESIVSVIRVKGGEQAFITNGRVEASSHLQAQQVQLTLGHLPTLLAADPQNVLVVGLGSGMTAGAASVHPRVRQVTLVEIEPGVLGVARSFADYNHHVLDNPKVKVVFNDGRNFLLTTDRKFDVITADPIHPWFRGAGYLYTTEYFALAARHLNPGGVVAQWLPIYELTPQDLASIARTFQEQFAYTALWLTHYDSVLVGSNQPLALDESQLEARMQPPEVAADLRRVTMGSADDLLSYFAFGTEGMRRFARTGVLNTDDRPYLEFSAPFSIAAPSVMAANVNAIAAQRESILPYLTPAADPAERAQQVARWQSQLNAARVGDGALALFLGGRSGDPAFLRSIHQLNADFPAYAPGTFLSAEYQRALALEPRLLQQESFSVLNDEGQLLPVNMCAVLVPVSRSRASLMFVDNHARVVYGQSYLDDFNRDGRADRLATDVMAAVRAAYVVEADAARSRQQHAPSARLTLPRFRAVIGEKVQHAERGS